MARKPPPIPAWKTCATSSPSRAGDFDNDGLPDLCVVTAHAALLYRNTGGQFKRSRNWREAPSAKRSGWTTITITTPTCSWWATIRACCAITARPVSATNRSASPSPRARPWMPCASTWSPIRRGSISSCLMRIAPGVLYRDSLGGTYTAQDIPELPAGALGLAAGDVNRDGRTDLAARLPGAQNLLLVNRDGEVSSRGRAETHRIPLHPAGGFRGQGQGRPRSHRCRRRRSTWAATSRRPTATGSNSRSPA